MSKDLIKLVEEGYDEIASSYGRDRHKFRNRPLLERFSRTLPETSHVLDIGCGAGIPVCRYFVDKGFTVTGIDLSQSMIDMARANVPEAVFIKKSMTEIDFPDRSFDGVVSCYALFHVPRDVHGEIIKDVFRMLKFGGSFLLSVGSTEGEGVEDFHGAPMYWSHYSPITYQEIFEDLGFEVTFAEPFDDGNETHFWLIGRKSPQ